MTYNVSWNKWITASIIDHFKTTLVANGLSVFVEGSHTRDLTNTEYVEIRVNGPVSDEHTKDDFSLKMHVNLLIQVIIDPTVNLYRNEEVKGYCVAAMVTIPVYKYGSAAGDDQSHIGCLTIVSEKPRERIQVDDFGQVETDIPLRQATVGAHYKIELEG